MTLHKNDTRFISGNIEPGVPKASQPDAPLVTSSHMKKAQTTQALFWMAKGRTRTYLWPQPQEPYDLAAGTFPNWRVGDMPWVKIEAARTWYTFQVGPFVGGVGHSDFHTDLLMPWMQSADFPIVEVRPRIIANSDLVVTLRVSSVTLIDAVTTTTSAAVATFPTNQLVSSIHQQYDRGRGWRAGKTLLEVPDPDLPASGIVALKLECMLPYDLPTLDVGGNEPEGAENRAIYLFLSSVLVSERIDRSNSI